MTETDINSLASLRIPELKALAAEKGIRGLSGLRKGDLIEKIIAASTGAAAQPAASAPEVAEVTEVAAQVPSKRGRRSTRTAAPEPVEENQAEKAEAEQGQAEVEQRDSETQERPKSPSAARRERRNRQRQRQKMEAEGGQETQDQDSSRRDGDEEFEDRRGPRRGGRMDRRTDRRQSRRDDRNDRNDRRQSRRDDSEEGGNYQEEQQVIRTVAGILDVIDSSTAFLRTSGYQAGNSDVYVSMSMVRKFGLRRGDAVTGQIKVREDVNGNIIPFSANKNGRHGKKYTPLLSVDSVNGLPVEEARNRPEFSKLTPLYPNQRLRLETDPKKLTTRVIDLVMPIGKGQRALIVSPPKAGKTTILQDIANAISTNYPECYLMVVLVDERPEEVTDMQRSVKGEVIASTFDRPPAEHTAVAELAIERAKRLVEGGEDVVLLLDSITRLGRAYNNSSPASGRILSGGVDSSALYPPKRFLGAARNIEEGGSLTIIATAMVETGSAGDTVIFEEFKGTGNAELKLDRRIAERRVFPAVDINPSGTRKDDLLLVPEEARILHKLRHALTGMDPQAAIEALIRQLRKTRSNGEFLLQLGKNGALWDEGEEEE